MTLTAAQKIQATRMLAGDKPKVLRNIQLGVGDGAENIFRVPILTVNVLDSGDPDLVVDLYDPNDSSYTVGVITAFDYETGDVSLSMSVVSGVVVIGYFSYVTFTDAEITFILGLDEISGCHYLAAAFCIQGILADTSRMISFSQGDASYKFDKLAERLESSVERLWKQSPLTSAVIAVPFNLDYLSRINYEPPPIVRLDSPYGRF